MAIKILANESFQDVLAEEDLALVDVYADWCGPCLRFNPIFEHASEQYPDIAFFKLDADTSPDFRKAYKIPALPFVLAFKKGELVTSGSLSTQAALIDFIDSLGG